MPGDNVLSAGAAAAVLGIWWAIDAFPPHRAIPSRDSDKGSLLALNVAHGFRLVGMLVGFLGVGRIDTADAPLQLSGLGLMVAGIAVRWTAVHALGVFFTGRVQIREGHTLIRTGLYSRLRHPAYAGSLLAYFGLGLAFSNWWTLACSVLPYPFRRSKSGSVACRVVASTAMPDVHPSYLGETEKEIQRPIPNEAGTVRWRILTTVLPLTCLAAASCAGGQTTTVSPDRQAKIETAISQFMATSMVPGVSVAIVQNGEFVWSRGFGMADLENSVPATADTLYRLGSVSKPITATAALVLSERGQLDLDAPIQKYCPSFPEKPWPITTRQLLGHLGGIRYYRVPETPYSVSQTDAEVGNTRHFEDGIDGGLKFFANDPLVAPPGTHFNYSTQGYTLVGCAIEGASGRKYADVVRESVLIRAGMLQTRPDDRFAIVPHRTRFYSKSESGAVVNAEFLDASYKVPGGGLLSSATDMARFEVAILKDQLIKRTTRDMMWTPQMPSDGLGRMVYGLGWQMGTTDNVAGVGHGGSQQGTSTMMLIAPDARAGVVVLTNSDAAGAPRLATEVLRILLGRPEHVHSEIAVAPALLDAYVGTYQSGDFTMVIAREGNRLVVQVGSQRIPLSAETTRDFYPKGADTHITFMADGNGRTTEVLLREGGSDLYAHRRE